MSDTKDGGPAFPARPTEHYGNGVSITSHHGMTLRDYFAAKAMQGLINPLQNPSDLQMAIRHKGVKTAQEFFASVAYDIADAMLKERDK